VISSSNDVAKHLVIAMTERKDLIINMNEALSAALYMDPRFNFRGSSLFNDLALKSRTQV
jgi:hypothetical protein